MNETAIPKPKQIVLSALSREVQHIAKVAYAMNLHEVLALDANIWQALNFGL